MIEKFEALSQRLTTILSQKSTDDGTESSVPSVATQSTEETVQELERRRANEDKLLLSGIDFSAKSKDDIVNLFQTEIQIDTHDGIVSINKPKANKRMLFLRFKDKQIRDSILKKASLFHKSSDPNVRNIYCNPVYTKQQLEQLRKLKEVLKERREAAKASGRDPSLIVLRGLRIVERKSKD